MITWFIYEIKSRFVFYKNMNSDIYYIMKWDFDNLKNIFDL
jgi:hypothetical protein